MLAKSGWERTEIGSLSVTSTVVWPAAVPDWCKNTMREGEWNVISEKQTVVYGERSLL